jgi:hypothetical protein
MASRRLKPYRQGRLDGLCGLYALINALRLLCPRLDEDDCERAFCALIRDLERQGCSLLNVIHRGLTQRELFRLTGSWQRFAARELGVALTVSRLSVCLTQPCATSGEACVGRWMARGLRSSAWTEPSVIGRWLTLRLLEPCGWRTPAACR